VFVLSGRGLCDGPIPCTEESYRLWCVFECDQAKINNLDTYCEYVEEGGTMNNNNNNNDQNNEDGAITETVLYLVSL
jgi:hypothetical protein